MMEVEKSEPFLEKGGLFLLCLLQFTNELMV